MKAILVVKLFQRDEIMPCLSEEAPANSVPAAAVRREGRVLFGMTGRKAYVGGRLCCIVSVHSLTVGLHAKRVFLSSREENGMSSGEVKF